jgi:probable HAF family extracellular repeat protein
MKPILASIAALAAFAAAQPQYNITDLGNVGVTPGQPFTIVNTGIISGAAGAANGATHAVLWYLGQKGDISSPGLGGLNSVALGVNDKGQVVGQAESTTPDPNGEDFCGFKQLGLPTKGTTCLPYLWQFGRMSPLPTLGGPNGVANQINARGIIAGIAENKTLDLTCPAPQKLQFKPVIWNKGQIEELPTFSSDPDGIAISINGNGQAVGSSGDCSKYDPYSLSDLLQLHALLWETNAVINLGNLGGTGRGGGNIAISINNSAQVVGNSDLPGDAVTHGFLWTKQKGIQDLGTLPGDIDSAGLGINDGGDIVGVSSDSSGNPRAFLREKGVMADLNSLVPADSSLYLLVACSINAHRQIIGFAFDPATNEVHGYLASPAGNAGGFSIAAQAVRAPVVLPEEARQQLRRQMRLGRYGARFLTAQ